MPVFVFCFFFLFGPPFPYGVSFMAFLWSTEFPHWEGLEDY